jgi:hypothetical protein
MGNLWYALYSKVIKIDVTWPFCVKHHIDVHLDVLFMFIKNNARKNLIAPVMYGGQKQIQSP